MVFGIPAAVYAAWRARQISDRAFGRLIAGTGIFLAVTEAFKQLLLYQAGGGHYDWWYFPFQLCSVPMYLCLLYPFLPREGGRTVLCTFMHNFSLLGAAAVLFDTSGLYHDCFLLTVHSFAWHLVIVFLGALIGFSGRMDISWKGYGRSLALFLLLCTAATGINVWAHPLGNINMFYISPYTPSSQVVFRDIAKSIGTIPTDFLYVSCIAAGAALLHAAERGYLRGGRKG